MVTLLFSVESASQGSWPNADKSLPLLKLPDSG
jgi:hypothetical protein